ncbi:MAG: 30S ribosomal protein S17 [Bdellovibrionota bacterium]
MESKSMNKAEKQRKIVSGTVLSNKMDKTIVVQVTSLKKHPKYGKFFRSYKKFKAHDETNSCDVGDRVEIIESRPISKEKKFRLYKVVQKVQRADLEVKDEMTEAGV